MDIECFGIYDMRTGDICNVLYDFDESAGIFWIDDQPKLGHTQIHVINDRSNNP